MTVEAAYAEVERLTRREARNFAYGIMVLPRPKRRAIAAIYAFARGVDDIADGAAAARREAGARLEELRAARSTRRRRRRDARRARRRARALSDPGRARCTTSSTAACRTPSRRATRRSRISATTADGSPARSASPASRCTAPRKSSARRDTRSGAAADQHHARRARGLGARPRLPAAGRAGGLRRHRGRDRRPAGPMPEWRALMAFQARARARLPRGRARAARLARLAQLGLRRDLRRPLPGDARPDRGARLRRLRRPAAPLAADEAAHRDEAADRASRLGIGRALLMRSPSSAAGSPASRPRSSSPTRAMP